MVWWMGFRGVFGSLNEFQDSGISRKSYERDASGVIDPKGKLVSLKVTIIICLVWRLR